MYTKIMSFRSARCKITVKEKTLRGNQRNLILDMFLDGDDPENSAP